ncbi:MAG: YHYH protein, partial [Crocinitomicaceae bacterium]
MDDHNGRFCITPEYPNGIYCYFATVDANWNSAYPYAVGPYFYGNKTATKVTTIGETVTTYTSTAGMEESEISVNVFPNPVNDLLIV